MADDPYAEFGAPVSSADPYADFGPPIKSAPKTAPVQNLGIEGMPPLETHGAAARYGLGQAAVGLGRGAVGLAQSTVPQTPGDYAASLIGGPMGVSLKRGLEGAGSLPSQVAQVPGAISDLASNPDGYGLAALSKFGPQAGGEGAFNLLMAKFPGMIDAIPSTARAGANLAKARQLASTVPVDTTAPLKAALEAKEVINAGTSNVPVVSKFLTRMKDPRPMTYAEIRNFYSNASKLSAQDISRLNPNMRRLVGNFAQKLGEAAQDAANRAGVGEAHASGMAEYRQASRLSSGIKNTAKAGAVLGGTGYLGHLILDRLMGGK